MLIFIYFRSFITQKFEDCVPSFSEPAYLDIWLSWDFGLPSSDDFLLDFEILLFLVIQMDLVNLHIFWHVFGKIWNGLTLLVIPNKSRCRTFVREKVLVVDWFWWSTCFASSWFPSDLGVRTQPRMWFLLVVCFLLVRQVAACCTCAVC